MITALILLILGALVFLGTMIGAIGHQFDEASGFVAAGSLVLLVACGYGAYRVGYCMDELDGQRKATRFWSAEAARLDRLTTTTLEVAK